MQRYQVKTWEELWELPGFQNVIGKDDLATARIIAPYHMSSRQRMEPCGIRQCRTKHRNGYVVRLDASQLTNVGHRCGLKHFGERRWKVELQRHKQIEQALAAQRANAEALEAARHAVANHPADVIGLRTAIRLIEAFNALPAALRDSLAARANDNQPVVTRLRPITEAEKKKMEFGGKRVIPLDVEEPVGTLLGLVALRQSHRADTLWKRDIPAITARLIEAADRGDAETIPAELRAYNAAMQRLDVAIRETDLFFEQRNLDLLPKLQAARRLGISRVVRTANDSLLVEHVR